MEENKKSLDGKLVAAIIMIAAGALLMLNTFNIVHMPLMALYFKLENHYNWCGSGAISVAKP